MELSRRWFPQIVDRDSRNLYPISAPFPCSDFYPKGGVVGGWNLISCFLRILYYFQHLKNNIFRTKISGGLSKIRNISFLVFFTFYAIMGFFWQKLKNLISCFLALYAMSNIFRINKKNWVGLSIFKKISFHIFVCFMLFLTLKKNC